MYHQVSVAAPESEESGGQQQPQLKEACFIVYIHTHVYRWGKCMYGDFVSEHTHLLCSHPYAIHNTLGQYMELL